MEKLDTVIKLVKKMTIQKVEWRDVSPHEQIINHTLEQQGIQKVITLLERIAEGDENLLEVMKHME
jgi:hypothetical protein